MIPIDNSGVLSYRKSANPLFATAFTFVYDPTARTFTITDATTYPTGNTRKNLNITIFDKAGKKKEDNLGTTGTSKAVDVSSLNPAQGLSAIITVVTLLGNTKDGTIKESYALTGAFEMEK